MKYVSDMMGWMAHAGPRGERPGGDRESAQPRAAPRQVRRRPSPFTPVAANDADVPKPKAARSRGLPWRAIPERSKPALVALSRVTGATVFDRQGRAAGQISDLSLEKSTGLVIYALVSFGGFLGLRSRLHPIPWALLRYDPQKEGYVIPLAMSDMDDAPSLTVDESEVLGAGDRAWRDRLAAYYAPSLNPDSI